MQKRSLLLVASAFDTYKIGSPWQHEPLWLDVKLTTIHRGRARENIARGKILK